MTIVNLYPDDPNEPHTWRSGDAADPEVVLLRRADNTWAAKLERRTVAHAANPEQLAARLYGDFGLVAVLDSNGVVA